MSLPSLPSFAERAALTFQTIRAEFALGPGHYRVRQGILDTAMADAYGVLFAAFLGAARCLERRAFVPLLRLQFDGLEDYWRPEGPVPGYNISRYKLGTPDRHYAHNALFAHYFAEAYRFTTDRDYNRRGRDALRFALSGYDARRGGGIYWFERMKTDKQCWATATTALALLRPLAPAMVGAPGPSPTSATAALLSDSAEPLQTALGYYEWLRRVLRAPDDGLYWDKLPVQGGGIVDQAKWSYNSGAMLQMELCLFRLRKDRIHRDNALALADAALRHWRNPATGLIEDDAAFAHVLALGLLECATVTGRPQYADAVRQCLDALWTRVRRPDGTYPKRWALDRTDSGPCELMWIASAARAYTAAVAYGL